MARAKTSGAPDTATTAEASAPASPPLDAPPAEGTPVEAPAVEVSPIEAPSDAADPAPPPTVDEPLDDQGEERRDALRFLAAMVKMREAVQRIHARQSATRDGTSALAAFSVALLSVGGGLPGFPPDPWPLKHLLDRPTYDNVDPDRNLATKALVGALFDCLEEGRLRPGRGDEALTRIADAWSQFETRGEAVRFEEAHERAQHRGREQRHAEEHAGRLAKQHLATVPRRPQAPEPPEPAEPEDLTVG